MEEVFKVKLVKNALDGILHAPLWCSCSVLCQLLPHVAEAPCHQEHSGRVLGMVFQKLLPSHHRHTETEQSSIIVQTEKCCSEIFSY